MGFNGCRKHQKVEDPVFLYWADRLGFLVWGEMANAYEFNEDYVERFSQEWVEAVKRDINHPSIVTWTPVNGMYEMSSMPVSGLHRGGSLYKYELTFSQYVAISLTRVYSPFLCFVAA